MNAERRAAIWLEKVAQQEVWQGEVRRRQAEANRARAAAATSRPRKPDGTLASAPTQCGQTGQARSATAKEAAAVSKTNRGAIERQTELRA